MISKRIHISIAARLIYHLGEQLISDELVALLELIKNSYDADATRCVVKVDSNAETPYGIGQIMIQDNGNGMLPYTVEHDFLRLATDYKKVNKVSPYYKRRTLGEKGLGRLSYQRLGRFVQICTVPRINRLSDKIQPEDENFISNGMNCIDVTMDWDGFSDSDDISKVFATVTERHEEGLMFGTNIVIQGIRNGSFWALTTEKRKRLQDEILALINPFAETKNNAAFNLELDVNGEKFLIDSIDESVVDQLSDVSSHFSFDGHTLELTARYKEKYITRQKDQYLKRCKEEGFIAIHDNFDFSQMAQRTFVAQLDSEKEWETTCQFPPHTVSLVGDCPAVNFVFDGSIYAVDKTEAKKTEIDKSILDESIFVQKNFRRINDLWDRIAGVYMYRDQFRILPYGKTDWLNLTRRSQKGKATILKQGNVSGYIHLNGEKSELIREQTNRQGILEDEYGLNFLLMLDDIIIEQLFRWDLEIRGQFTMPKLDKADGKYWSPGKKIEFDHLEAVDDKYKERDVALDSVLRAAKEMSPQVTFDEADKLKKHVEAIADSATAFKKASAELRIDYQQRLSMARQKLSEYEEIIPLLGQTLIIETTTHELNRIYSNMAQSAKNLSTYISHNSLEDSTMSQIALRLKKEISELDLQLNHLMPTQRHKLKDVQCIDLCAFFREQYVEKSAVTDRLKKKAIVCNILGDTFSIMASKGNMIVIFDNLVINSEYWLEKSTVDVREINFECHYGNVLQIWDSGLGISKEIENTLFEPFQTLKRDGRGLGLYIVQELLALMGASIELLQERNTHGNRYKFEIVFQERDKDESFNTSPGKFGHS